MSNCYVEGKAQSGELVSLIIPVYNCEKTLGFCLNSLLSQTYVDWQAILVDMGSYDDSLKICHQYMALDSRFHLYHISGHSLEAARTEGLKHAEGRYLEFLASNHCMRLETLERQVDAMKNQHCQLVVSDGMYADFLYPGSTGKRVSGTLAAHKGDTVSGSRLRRACLCRQIDPVLVYPEGKLFDRNLWTKWKLRYRAPDHLLWRFAPHMVYYCLCRKAVFLGQIGSYMYRRVC